jgi:hypothetical protein
MREVVYAIRISHLEYSGLKIMDIKIGKSTDIDNTLRQYSRGNRDIELLDMWTPNPDMNLSTAERGVHAVAERYAYDKQSEKFVFLQSAYQEFAETVNMLLRNVSREDLATVVFPAPEGPKRKQFSARWPPSIGARASVTSFMWLFPPTIGSGRWSSSKTDPLLITSRRTLGGYIN